MKVNSLIIISVLLIFIMSCNSQGGGNDDIVVTDKEKVITKEKDEPVASTEQDFMEEGKKVYERLCLACHQTDGSGVPNMYPPVIESDYISGNTDSLIHIILEGMKGPVIIKGEEYNSIMPPMKDVLDDQEIADLINYLRNSFGNSGEFVKPEDVADMR